MIMGVIFVLASFYFLYWVLKVCTEYENAIRNMRDRDE